MIPAASAIIEFSRVVRTGRCAKAVSSMVVACFTSSATRTARRRLIVEMDTDRTETVTLLRSFSAFGVDVCPYSFPDMLTDRLDMLEVSSFEQRAMPLLKCRIGHSCDVLKRP